MALLDVVEALLDGEQAWTSILNLKSFVMDSVQVGKAVFGKEIHTTLGIGKIGEQSFYFQVEKNIHFTASSCGK